MAEEDSNVDSARGPMDQLSAHLDRGWDLIHRGDFPGAQRSAEKGLELDGESPEAHNLLGYASAAQGEHEAALEHYRQAIALDESFVEAMLNAAEVLIHPLHDFGEAIELIDSALEWAEGPDEIADALLLKFDAAMHQGDKERAKKVLRTLPEEAFESARLDFLVGRAYFEVGELDAAHQHLERALERDATAADVHYYFGLVLDGKGLTPEATVYFLRCRELDARLGKPHWSLSATQFERRVRGAIERLEAPHRNTLEGALVVVSDLPGAEVVADGVDPRAAVFLDALSEKVPIAGRAFVYQRNAERLSEGPDQLEDDLLRFLKDEIESTFPDLAGEKAAAAPPTPTTEQKSGD